MEPLLAVWLHAVETIFFEVADSETVVQAIVTWLSYIADYMAWL